MQISHSTLWRIARSAILAFCAAVLPGTLTERHARGEIQGARADLTGYEESPAGAEASTDAEDLLFTLLS